MRRQRNSLDLFPATCLSDTHAMAHDAAVEYAENVTQDQLAALQQSVNFSLEDGVDHVRWSCPRCHAEFDQSFHRDDPVYGFDVDTVDIPKDQGLLDLVCKCGVKHPGGESKPGCGFAAHVPVKAA
jgi:hypothetical protein